MSQQQSQHEIFKQLSQMADCKEKCTAREALEELLPSSPTYSSEELSTTVPSYDKSLISIPSAQCTPIELAGVLDEVGRETIKDLSVV